MQRHLLAAFAFLAVTGLAEANPMTTISGTVGKTSSNSFMLDTAGGPTLVTTGPKGYHQLDLKTGEKVSVTGQRGAVDFDAFQIKRANGQTIEIRPVEGPPPWARGGARDRGEGPPPWARDRGEGPPPWAGADRRDGRSN